MSGDCQDLSIPTITIPATLSPRYPVLPPFPLSTLLESILILHPQLCLLSSALLLLSPLSPSVPFSSLLFFFLQAITAVKKVVTRRGDYTEVDVKRYVRIEKIPGGELSDCCVLDGVMFNKGTTLFCSEIPPCLLSSLSLFVTVRCNF